METRTDSLYRSRWTLCPLKRDLSLTHARTGQTPGENYLGLFYKPQVSLNTSFRLKIWIRDTRHYKQVCTSHTVGTLTTTTQNPNSVPDGNLSSVRVPIFCTYLRTIVVYPIHDTPQSFSGDWVSTLSLVLRRSLSTDSTYVGIQPGKWRLGVTGVDILPYYGWDFPTNPLCDMIHVIRIGLQMVYYWSQ